jgi:hypothetical protein
MKQMGGSEDYTHSIGTKMWRACCLAKIAKDHLEVG